MSDLQTTIHLVNRAKAGENGALNLLMERYLQRILRIVRARLGPQLRTKVESMDVVQEVMIRAVKAFDNFEPKDEAAFLHWISKLVQNEICDLADYHGAQKRNLHQEIQSKQDSEKDRSILSNIPADSLYRPSFQLRLKEDVLALEAAMDNLSQVQKEIVIMRQYEGLSFKEIGTELNLSEDAARMQFARAINKLTDFMTQTNE
ncbi:MAG: sigma-70 family RNA polymerase sigma factor [Deltaproteobacteria bacterium]|nr:sigma-70 family RNA polymerase sigma factor [Deltaproteobacteria bacterium]